MTLLSAFPLTPLRDHGSAVDADAFARLVRRLPGSGAAEIGVLGSTGIYPYLSRDERRRVVETAAAEAGGLPLTVGIGALTTREVMAAAADAQEAGAAALLLAPVSYHPLTEREVWTLFSDVAAGTDVPLVIYDAPRTTGFTFSDALLARLGQLPAVTAVKSPAVAGGVTEAAARLATLCGLFPQGTRIGVSGDALAGPFVAAGADVWYSAMAGTLPHAMASLMAAARPQSATSPEATPRAATAGENEVGDPGGWERLEPLWRLTARHGGAVRVATAIALYLGLVGPDSLPRPLLPLQEEDQAEVVAVVTALGLLDGE